MESQLKHSKQEKVSRNHSSFFNSEWKRIILFFLSLEKKSRESDIFSPKFFVETKMSVDKKYFLRDLNERNILMVNSFFMIR